MKILFFLYFVIAIVRSHELERYLQVSSSATTWRSCVESSFQKWCKDSFATISGECCTLNDNSGRCSGTNGTSGSFSSGYICSNDDEVDERGGTALCPSDTANCGNHEIELSYNGDKESRTRSSVSSGTVWVYKITKFSSFVNAAKITISKLGVLMSYFLS